MIKCPTCKHDCLELLLSGENGSQVGQCETCYRQHVIAPLVALRAAALSAVTEVDRKLTAALEVMARSYRHDFNMSFKCDDCGKLCKSGLDTITHKAEDCPGPLASRPVTKRQQFQSKIKDETVEEFG